MLNGVFIGFPCLKEMANRKCALAICLFNGRQTTPSIPQKNATEWRNYFAMRRLGLLCAVCNISPNRGVGGAILELPVILVIEDEQDIQSLIEDALTEGGFESAIAASGEEAVTLLTGYKGKYRALITDINLKGRLSGWDVAQRAREIEPDFPVVYMSGAAAGDWTSKGVPNSIMLAKPFAPAQLLTAVSTLLNSTPPILPN